MNILKPILYSLLIQKIISGGQTGVDQAALEVGLQLGIPIGGWCPPGRICENGIIPFFFPLTETPEERSEKAPDIPRSLRTEWNVRDADATIIFKPSNQASDKGTNWTEECINLYKKRFLKVDPFEEVQTTQIKSWLLSPTVLILNVAGPSEGTYPGIGKRVKEILWQVFRA